MGDYREMGREEDKRMGLRTLERTQSFLSRLQPRRITRSVWPSIGESDPWFILCNIDGTNQIFVSI